MIGIGIVGFGYWGPNLVRNFAETPGAKLVSVADLRPDRLEVVRSRYPGVQTTTSVDELIDDPQVDAVVIATPVGSHFALAERALRAGKHVLVEKPLTTSAVEAEQLIELAERRGLTLMVDHTFVYTGAVRKIRELIDLEGIGDCYYYDSVRVNLGLFQHDVSVIWDLAVHDVSIMDHVLRMEPVAVSATGVSHVPGQPENIAYITLFMPGSLIAHIHINWLAPVKVRRTLIGGSSKMIVYDDLEPSEKIKVYDKGISINGNTDKLHRLLIDYRSGDMWAPKLDATEALLTEARHFIECMTTGATPITDGHAGLRVVRILEAATRSLARRGEPVELSAEMVLS
jgi:predicted dehydrogenase